MWFTVLSIVAWLEHGQLTLRDVAGEELLAVMVRPLSLISRQGREDRPVCRVGLAVDRLIWRETSEILCVDERDTIVFEEVKKE